MELRVTLLILSVINGIDAILRAKRQYGFYQPPVEDWSFDPHYYQPYVVNYEPSNSYGVPSSYNNYVDDRYSTSGRSLMPHQAPDGWRLDHQVQQNGYSQGRQRFDIPRIREFDRTLVSVTDGYATPPPEGFNGRGDVTSGGRGDVISERPSGDVNQWNTLRTDFDRIGFRKEDSDDVTTAFPEVSTTDDVTSFPDDVTSAHSETTSIPNESTSHPDDVTITSDDVTSTPEDDTTPDDDVTNVPHDVTLLPDDVTDSEHPETSTSTEPSLTSDSLDKIVEDDINSLSTTTTTITTTTTSKPRSPPMPQEVMKKLKELGLVIDKNNTDMID